MAATAPPVGRYGPAPDPRRRRLGVVALVLLGVAGLALVVWFGLGAASAPVRWSQVGFHVLGADAVEVTYQVHRTDPAVPVECTVEAQSAAHAQVGVVVVEVPASSDTTVQLTTTVRTSESAVTGFVDECRRPTSDGAS